MDGKQWLCNSFEGNEMNLQIRGSMYGIMTPRFLFPIYYKIKSTHAWILLLQGHWWSMGKAKDAFKEAKKWWFSTSIIVGLRPFKDIITSWWVGGGKESTDKGVR